MEHALRLQPASPLTGPAERLRESFAQSRSRERRWRLDVRLGTYLDDNATVRPDAKPGDDTVTQLREGPHETVGASLALRAEYDWLKSGPWGGTAGYSFFTTHNNDLPKLNVLDHQATLGVSHQALLGAMPLQSGIQYAFEVLLLEQEELLQRHAASLFATLVESPRHLSNAIFKVEVKEYSETRPLERAEFQDGNNYMIGLLHLLRFSEDRHFVKVGYQFDLEDAQGKNFAYLGHRFLIGAQYTLPWHDIRLVYDFNLHYRDYQFRHTRFPDANPGTRERSDREYTHVFRVEVPLPGSFTLGADYQGTIQNSNLAPFAYHRNIYTLWVSWAY